MKAPLSWLKEFVDIDVTAEQLQEKLFDCGFEVEELTYVGKDISGVVVGEVIFCEPVEGTHLSLCRVDCGDKGTFQICCGADNVKKGIKAPCALIGATVYATAKDHVTVEGVMTIKKGKLRGIESDGMLCSGAELGVNGDMYEGGDYCGLLILPDSCKNGEDVKDILGLNDYIFDIAVTANRPDCQSILGIAREIAAALDKPVKQPDLSYTQNAGVCAPVHIRDEAGDLCPRYIGHAVGNVKIAPSPAWMKRRLALCGLRSINNIVDITNYILLEMGQPMHAFDMRTLGGRTIIIRRANDGEKIVTLDENEFTLNGENLVICDESKPVALAGVMGGLNSEIKDDTAEVLFEAAKFARDNVRKTARALGQHSDSSAIFEKGVYEYTTERAMKRALNLIEKLGCGTVSDVHADICPAGKPAGRKMQCSISKINSLLGIEVPADEITGILKRLNFGVNRRGDLLELDIPEYREDIDGYPDIAEEVIRMYGYKHICGTFLPSASITNGGYNAAQKAELRLKEKLVAAGMYEISTYSFYSEKDLDMLRLPADAAERKAIKILNPIGEDLSLMRTTLAPSMLNVITRNQRRGNAEGKLFELAKIYIAEELPIKNFPEEKPTLCMGIWGNYDFFDLKGCIERVAKALNVKFDYAPSQKPYLHPGITAEISCEGEIIGYAGQVAPTVAGELALEKPAFIAELDYAALSAHAKPFKYNPLPKFAVATRDLALVCGKDITCAQIEKEIYGACKYVTDVKLFDVYAGEQVGEGKKSMAFTVTFTPADEAIDERIDGFVKKILNNLKFKLDVQLR